MSPVSLQHSYYAKEIGILLEEFLEGGFSLLEAAVETTKGTRVPDVACFLWKSFSTETLIAVT